MYRSEKNEAISMAECLSRVILSEGNHPRSASFLDHVQTDAVYFEDGNVSALQLNKNSPNWAESHEKAFEKEILSFQTEIYSLGRGRRAKREFVILPTDD